MSSKGARVAEGSKRPLWVKRVKAVVVPTAEVVSRSLVEKSRRSMTYVQVECDGIGTVK